MHNAKNIISLLIANIDDKIKMQLVAITSDSALNELFSRWIELMLLVTEKSSHQNIKIKLLNITWNEIEKDLNSNSEIDITKLFNIIHEQELGTTGGEPYSILLGQYKLNLMKLPVVSTLQKICDIAAFSFAPCISNVAPESFSLSSFKKLNNFDAQLKTSDFGFWQKLRQTKSARFLYMTLPNLLYRGEQPVSDPIKSTTIFKNLSILSNTILALQMIGSFIESGWFNSICGDIDLDSLTSSITPSLPFLANRNLNTPLHFTKHEEELAIENGFIPMTKHDTQNATQINTIYACSSVGELSEILLEHMMCACRLGHYIKLYTRDKIGTYSNISGCEQYLKNWLLQFTSISNNPDVHHHFPLKNSDVKLFSIPGKPGAYNCIVRLEPYMKLEALNTQITLQSELFSEK